MKIASIVGARPQFIKLAPLVREFKKHNINHLIIHTGQHYDYLMNKVFFDELGIPEPDYNLEVGSGSHGWQTGEMLKKTEEVLLKEMPNLVLVYGDTNSTLSGALASAKLHIPVVHVEAGLRSYNKNMPEEINRVLTDHVSDILFCPSETAVRNLKNEGFINILNEGKLLNSKPSQLPNPLNFPVVVNVGDVMYDVMLMSLEIAEKRSKILEALNLTPKEYYLATIHRAENTDTRENLRSIFEFLTEMSKDKPVIVPLHPRTKRALQTIKISLSNSIKIIEPVGYFDMLILEKNAYKILTDSGGVQKEAYWLRVPCITLRNETEWIETVESGWNILYIDYLTKGESSFKTTDFYYGDGKASERIAHVMLELIKNLRR